MIKKLDSKPYTNLINKSNKGNLMYKIIGGFKAKIGHYPYQVSLQHIGNRTRNYCGGCIINEESVITAAHCISGIMIPCNEKKIVVAAGLVTLGSEDAVYHNVDECIIHHHYERGIPQNDVAILKIEDVFEFNRYVRPVQYATEAPNKSMICIVSGWGAINTNQTIPSDLYAKTLITNDATTCQKYFKFNRVTEICAFGHRTEEYSCPLLSDPNRTEELCTSEFDDIYCTCGGDSGSPLVCNNSLFGIITYCVGNCEFGFTVFSNVYYHKGWIEENLNRGLLVKFNTELLTVWVCLLSLNI